jgi:hypothetical protein
VAGIEGIDRFSLWRCKRAGVREGLGQGLGWAWCEINQREKREMSLV